MSLSAWFPSTSLGFWSDSASGVSWVGLISLKFFISPGDSFSVSDSAEEVPATDTRLLFLCFLLFFLLFLVRLWCRRFLLSALPFSCSLRFLGLLSRLRFVLFPSLLELLDFSLSLLQVSLSFLLLYLSSLLFLYPSLLFRLSLSVSLSRLLLLLWYQSLLLSLCLDLDDLSSLNGWDITLSRLLLLHLSPARLLWDLSDLGGLLLQRRCQRSP